MALRSSIGLVFVRCLLQSRISCAIRLSRTESARSNQTLAWANFKGVQIQDSDIFTCGHYKYKYFKPLGYGFEGVTVILQRPGKGGHLEQVVAKFTREPWNVQASGEKTLKHQGRYEFSIAAKTLQKECQIYDTLQKGKVPNTLSCEAMCLHGPSGAEHQMIVVSPFVQNAKPWSRTWIGGYMFKPESRPFGADSPIQITDGENTPLDPRVKRGLLLSFQTVWSMLAAHVANRDQHHNILYEIDGTPTFIDMGHAEDFSKATQLEPIWYVGGFLDASFRLIPPLMLDWAEQYLILSRPALSRNVRGLNVHAFVDQRWQEWRQSEGRKLADEEAGRLREAFERLCDEKTSCPKAMCDFGSFKVRCAKCPQCMQTANSTIQMKF